MRLIFVPLLFTFILLQTNPSYAQTEKNPLEKQITSFITGLQPESPKQAVDLWILGVKNRSGAVQYAVLSPSLKKLTCKQFELRGWVTGQSSPWVDNFRILKVEQVDKKLNFTIGYNLLTSYKNFGTGQKVITAKKIQNKVEKTGL